MNSADLSYRRLQEMAMSGFFPTRGTGHGQISDQAVEKLLEEVEALPEHEGRVRLYARLAMLCNGSDDVWPFLKGGMESGNGHLRPAKEKASTIRKPASRFRGPETMITIPANSQTFYPEIFFKLNEENCSWVKISHMSERFRTLALDCEPINPSPAINLYYRELRGTGKVAQVIGETGSCSPLQTNLWHLAAMLEPQKWGEEGALRVDMKCSGNYIVVPCSVPVDGTGICLASARWNWLDHGWQLDAKLIDPNAASEILNQQRMFYAKPTSGPGVQELLLVA